MEKNWLYFTLVILLLMTLLIYCIFIILDETRKYKKIKFYKSKIHYELDYEKYFKMVKKMKKIIIFKKTEIIFLKIILFTKGVFIWRKY